MNSLQNSPMIDVLDVLEACTPVIYRLARDYNVDADDLTQDLVVKMLEDARSLEKSIKKPVVYYIVKARYMAIERAPRDLSLDSPIVPESPVTFAETLPAAPIGREEDHRTEDARAKALHTALAKMPVDEQEHFCSVYGITAYTPTDTGIRSRRYLQKESRSKKTISVHGYKRIRKDQELLRAVQETYNTPAV